VQSVPTEYLAIPAGPPDREGPCRASEHDRIQRNTSVDPAWQLCPLSTRAENDQLHDDDGNSRSKVDDRQQTERCE
jgi:hypothetical protein